MLPEDQLITAIRKTTIKANCCADYWRDTDLEYCASLLKIRLTCDEDYHALRRRCINLRKAGKVGAILSGKRTI